MGYVMIFTLLFICSSNNSTWKQFYRETEKSNMVTDRVTQDTQGKSAVW